VNVTSFMELARLLPEALLLVDDEGTVLATGPAAQQLLGPLRGSPPLSALLGDDEEEVGRFLRRAARGADVVAARFAVREPDGRRTEREVRGGPLGLSDGGDRLLVLVRVAPAEPGSVDAGDPAVLSDTVERLEWEIAEHRRTERRLRMSEERLQAVLDHTTAVVYVKNVDGRYVMANRAMARLLGADATPDDVIGRSDDDLFGPDDAARRRATDDEVLLGRTPVTLEEHLEHEGDVRRSVSVKVPLLDASGRPYGLAVISTDMTEHFLAQQMLRERTRQLIEAQRIARIGSWTWDAASGEVELSYESERLLGSGSGGRWTIADIAEQIHPDDHPAGYRALEELEAGRPIDLVLRLVRLTGEIGWVQIRTERTVDPTGRVIGTWQDVTEREEADRRRAELEARLQQAQRMESVGLLAGGVAHDFNNLLAVMSIHAELARRALPEEHPSGESLDQLRKAIEMATTLTRRLMVFARSEVGDPVAIDLNVLLLDIVALLRRTLGPHISLETDLAGDLHRILADSGQVEQVLVNLAVNARDAMVEGGTLRLTTRNVRVDAARQGVPASLEPGDHVELTVSDTGIGMPADVLERAVEPFFTTKPMTGGTGLGLATVYGIVHQAGGELELRSEAGRGTDVVIWLPAAPAGAAGAPDRPGAREVPSVGGTVLVVEDQEPLAALVATLLEEAGYRVLSASDGVEALEVAEAADELHLLLTDVMLPRMKGTDLAARLLVERPSLRVVFMSGFTGGMLADQPGLAEDVPLLAKPFATADLLETVARALGRSG